MQRPVEQPEQLTTRSGRVRRKAAWMEDYVLDDNFNNEAHLCMAAVVSSTGVPSSIKEALDDPNWKAAINTEFDSLVDNKVWILVPKQENRKIISGKWHFVVKHCAYGEILKYKARYVVKGFIQIFGVDLNETYSPTVRLTSLRCLWAIAAQQKCLVYQVDIKMAYLNAPIDEEIYMQQPEGFESSDA